MPDPNTKEILWQNIVRLMFDKWQAENLTQFRIFTGIGSNTVSEMKAQTRSVGIDVLEKIAQKFKLKPYQLLMPRLGADIMVWPFKRITRERIATLSSDDLAYVEGRLEEMLHQVEDHAQMIAQQAIEQANLDALTRQGKPRKAEAAQREHAGPVAKPNAKRRPRK